ncbi:MAG: nucleoside recognition protein, partial [Sulfurimonas sp.]|nr:nucleoside recognition protein [Sulfurimonas sp.]
SWFEASLSEALFSKPTYETLDALLMGSVVSAISLSIKIIALITVLIFVMDFIKTRKFILESQKNVSKGFSLLVGIFLGITYGAGILIEEAKSGAIKKDDLFYIGTFLMICHAIIEDTLLFVIFGADFSMVIAIRTIGAIVISSILLKIYRYSSSDI